MKTVYHYTSESGFRALSSGATWYPSTGIPLVPGRSLLEHMQRSIIEDQRLFFREQYTSRDYQNKGSAHFPYVHYGPGWYVTETPPDTPTQVLVDALWQGDPEFEERTEYWLKLVSAEHRVKSPDASWPSVLYLPVYDKLGGDTNRPAGWSSDPVFLVEAGCRSESSGGVVNVHCLRSYDPPIEVISAMIAVFDGWSFLGTDNQSNVLGFLGFDSGFPGVPFPHGVAGLSVNRKQLCAIAQIATRSLGSDFELLEALEPDQAISEDAFSFEFIANLTVGDDRLITLVHCRQQRSPMRLEHAKSLVERGMARHADLVIAFVTSTYAENAIALLKDARVAPVLVTCPQRANRTRPEVRMAIMDGDVVEYPPHDFWVPMRAGDRARFEEVRRPEQVLQLAGRGREA